MLEGLGPWLPLAEALGVPLSLRVPLPEPLGVPVSLLVIEDVTDAVPDALDVADSDGVMLGDCDEVCDPVPDDAWLGDCDGDCVGVSVPLEEPEGVPERLAVLLGLIDEL